MDKQTLPLLALRGIVIYPGTTVHFEVSRKKSLKSLEEAMNKEQHIFLVSQLDPMVENPVQEDLYQIGINARILQMVKVGQGILRVYVEGISRASLQEVYEENGVTMAKLGDVYPVNFPVIGHEEDAYLREIEESLQDYIAKNPKFLNSKMQGYLEHKELHLLMYEIMSALPADAPVKQEFLEEIDVKKQAEKLILILQEETSISAIRDDLAGKVKKNVDKNQREYLLREQQKVIRKELGEDDIQSDSDEYLEKCQNLKASKEIKEKIEKEIKRFKMMPPASSESIVLRNYIENMLEMPWNHKSKSSNDIKKAITILNEDHYGLDKVKERVIDYLAVRTLSKKGDAPILCLVGPPGTGKTSIAKSIARALNKKYIRLSLGGVRDEAEIRGHRKTYVGAMPGRIAEGIRQAGVKNPLMLLDEIDKVSSDHKGDTASALLEVLDGEQNVRFRDHFLEVPLDLSEVFFVATANDPSLIAKPLLDRMEIIELSTYTENEKYHIASRYLIGKQQNLCGLKDTQISISDQAIYEIIRSYTREAGVRNLERKIGTLMHKAARNVLENGAGIAVTEDNLSDYLGRAPYSPDDIMTEDQIGITRGLAWTAVGGDTLSIEVNLLPGKGKLELTGRLGDVMKESALIALSYIRSVADEYGIAKESFENTDIHIHIPEGAVPKDGPSAGITMTTAMLSAFTKKAVRGDLAMTGEVTLRGRVLPIGGLKEKTLAAKAAGMKHILVPVKNQKDVDEFDEEITSGLQIHYVTNMEEVIAHAFVS